MSNMNSTRFLTLFEELLLESSHRYFSDDLLINKAVNYSLLSEGKRIRPLFCLGFCHALQGNVDFALRCALAVEMIHTYSLIHDDLPSMDNDDFRRGKATNHKVFGEAHAILAGDSLLTAAPYILMQELTKIKTNPELIVMATSSLLEASGHLGMIKGQAFDIEAEKQIENSSWEQRDLITIHSHKTGKLIAWSCLAGLYSTQNDKLIKKLTSEVEKIGYSFGLLFQIIDDILDATSTLSALGKTPGKDLSAGKKTYLSEYGLEGARKLAEKICEEIKEELSKISIDHSDWSVVNDSLQMLEKKIRS
jgi:geranylgeranyl diphosphate synthase type II